MDTVTFNNDFWGEKNQGFDVLYHNMKHGHNAAKDFIEFLRERATLEESYAKSLNKQSKFGGVGAPSTGTFSPLWTVMRSSKERLGTVHAKLGHQFAELAKEVEKYSATQKDRHKLMKEELNPTLEALQALETSQGAVAKSRKSYLTSCHELEEARETFVKAQKEGHKAKEIEKLEARMKKVDANVNAAEVDYKTMVMRQESACKDFETKMIIACERLQDLEDHHLQKMHLFVSKYLDLEEEKDKEIQDAVKIVRIQTLEQTVSKLLADFIRTKKTGKERPARAKFEVNPISSTPLPKMKDVTLSPSLAADTSSRELPRSSSSSSNIKKSKSIGIHWKKKRKQKDAEGAMSPQPGVPVGPVDEEGYSIRPPDAGRIGDGEQREGSDFSSESEDESSMKIKTLRIKPVSSSELNKSGGAEIKLAKPGAVLVPLNDSESKINSGSHSSLMDMGIDEMDSSRLPRALSESQARASQGLAPTASSSPSLSGGGLLAPPPGSRASVRTASPAASSTPTASPSGGNVPPMPLKQKLLQPTITLPSPINSPASAGGGGPSHPIAMAFSEQVNAMFKDPNPRNCLIKVAGDVMVSFPTAVVQQMLSQSSSLPPLTLKISDASKLDQVLPNKHILEITSNDGNTIQLKFFMTPLAAFLKKLVDQSPSSSYHNVDILKYQVRVADGSSLPFTFVGKWVCEPTQSTLTVDYACNAHAIPGSKPLTNVQIIAPVSGGVQKMETKPNATWVADQQRVVWKFPELNGAVLLASAYFYGIIFLSVGSGSLRGQFTLGSGPGQPSPVAALFLCEETTLSGISAQLIGSGYRLSLLKKSFKSGKYTAEWK
ncbi:F-BAR domain only protein 2-like isoform X2 [Oscarella lobularis]|uniref:F-BAR domain only protein 2-like isoform X2 n=1 Tax=Oscarella lobularis TaxID=121494 RepID=UPI0033144318